MLYKITYTGTTFVEAIDDDDAENQFIEGNTDCTTEVVQRIEATDEV